MSVIRPEDLLSYFEKANGVCFMDIRTGRLALEVLQEEKEKSDYDRWLETQDEATQREHKMGEF
jgi:riboflavin synthase